MKLLTKEEQGSYENAKTCFICKEEFENRYLKDTSDTYISTFLIF